MVMVVVVLVVMEGQQGSVGGAAADAVNSHSAQPVSQSIRQSVSR